MTTADKSQLFTAYNVARHLAGQGYFDRKRLDRALGVAQCKTERPYETTAETCTCKDAIWRPEVVCKHRLAALLRAVSKGDSMTQLQKVSGRATSITRDADGVHVQYHWTKVVSISADGFVTLRSGGYQTVTTKTRMNQAANQFALGFQVWQKDWSWFVTLPNGRDVPFRDGMLFKAGCRYGRMD